jgi:hypothetical protein
MHARIFFIAVTIPTLAALSMGAQPASDQAQPTTVPADVYLFSFFRGNGEDGLHLAASDDGLRWTALKGNRSFLRPDVGSEKLMRDPCVCGGPDGEFHMVWTTGWRGRDIGYAHSRDLIHWSKQQAIPVMAHEPDALNCWAPEIVYDRANQRYVIFWATTIPGRFPATDASGDNRLNHRIYFTTTTNFTDFTPAAIFFDPGFSVIDATLFEAAAGKFILFFKDETAHPVKKHLRFARGDAVTGPFKDLSEPFTPAWCEGPTALKVSDRVIVYYDMYREHHYGAMRTSDFKTWEDLTPQISFPDGTRHGTTFAVDRTILNALRQEK